MPTSANPVRSTPRIDRRRLLASAVTASTVAALGHGTGFAQDPTQGQDPVSGTYPLASEPTTLRVLAPNNPAVARFADSSNAFSKWYAQRTNVKIEWQVIAAEDAETVFLTRLLANDLPDVFLGFAPSSITLAIANGGQKLVDLASTIGDQTPELTRLLAAVPEATPAMTSADGAVWGFPVIRQHLSRMYPHKLFAYQPWLDQLGIPAPTTTDAFHEMLAAFQTSLGQEGVLTMTGTRMGDGTDVLDPLLASFVFNPGQPYIWLKDGEVAASYLEDGWRDGIAWIASLYAEGLIDPGSFTQSPQDFRARVNGEPAIVGVVPGMDWTSFLPFNADKTDMRWAEYALLPPLAPPNGSHVSMRDPMGTVTPGAFMVTTECPDPALAVRWADGLYDLETSLRNLYGPLDSTWRWATEGETGRDGNPAIWSQLRDYDSYAAGSNRWGGTGVLGITQRIMDGEFVNPDIEAVSNLDKQVSTLLEPSAAPPEQWLPSLTFTSDQAMTISTAQNAILPYVRDTAERWATNVGSVMDEWDAFKQHLDTLGMQECLTAYREALQSSATATPT